VCIKLWNALDIVVDTSNFGFVLSLKSAFVFKYTPTICISPTVNGGISSPQTIPSEVSNLVLKSIDILCIERVSADETWNGFGIRTCLP
jgi:hypothetical protein